MSECRAWCRYRGHAEHPTIDEPFLNDPDALEPVHVEHAREFETERLPSGRVLSVELVEVQQRIGSAGPAVTIEGPGISLAGLLDAATGGHLLTSAQAEELAAVLVDAAAFLDALDEKPSRSA